jgi:hypothetical protein
MDSIGDRDGGKERRLDCNAMRIGAAGPKHRKLAGSSEQLERGDKGNGGNGAAIDSRRPELKARAKVEQTKTADDASIESVARLGAFDSIFSEHVQSKRGSLLMPSTRRADAAVPGHERALSIRERPIFRLGCKPAELAASEEPVFHSATA